jgi:hypothetical protein
MHGFDFEYGKWRVHHRVKSAANGTWKEFDGTCMARPFMAGQRENRPRALDVVAYDAHISALGASKLGRCRQDMGHKLDHGIPARIRKEQIMKFPCLAYGDEKDCNALSL